MTAYHNALDGIHFEMAGPQDIPELLRLINAIQPHVPWDEEMLSWQYFEPPAGHARLYVAKNETGAIIAQYVAVPYQFKINESSDHISWMIQDVMTDPDYRGRGILHELGRRCIEDIRNEPSHYAHTFPNEKSNGSFIRNGFHPLTIVPARQLDLSEVVTQNLSELKEVSSAHDLDLSTLPQSYCGVERSHAYLSWRYRKPGCTYRFFNLEGGGYAVTKRYQGDRTRVFHLLDFALSHDAAMARRQLQSLIALAKEDHAQTITCWLHEEHPYAKMLDQAGLKYPSERRPVIFYVDGDSNHIQDPSIWLLTQGDSDVY